jgi:hypothetical protein
MIRLQASDMGALLLEALVAMEGDARGAQGRGRHPEPFDGKWRDGDPGQPREDTLHGVTLAGTLSGLAL